MEARYINEDSFLSQEDLVKKYGADRYNKALYQNTAENQDPEGELKSYIDAPRWAKVPKFLRQLAFELDLKIDIDVEKSLLRERTYFTVYGKKSQLEKFKNVFEVAIANHNDK